MRVRKNRKNLREALIVGAGAGSFKTSLKGGQHIMGYRGFNESETKELSWDDFSDPVTDRIEKDFLPANGEGDSMMSQAVTATTKLIYKWFNDGDVFDNTFGLQGWANDLSDYANWLDENIPEAAAILSRIKAVGSDESAYTQLLYDLMHAVFNDEMIVKYADKPVVGTIYDCSGPYSFYVAPTCPECGQECDEWDYQHYGMCSDCYNQQWEEPEEEEEYDESVKNRRKRVTESKNLKESEGTYLRTFFKFDDMLDENGELKQVEFITDWLQDLIDCNYLDNMWGVWFEDSEDTAVEAGIAVKTMPEILAEDPEAQFGYSYGGPDTRLLLLSATGYVEEDGCDDWVHFGIKSPDDDDSEKDFTEEDAVAEAFPNASEHTVDIIAGWYKNEGAIDDFDSKEEFAEHITDDFMDMFWAGDYNDDEFHEVATDMINAGYYEEDDFPYGDEDLNESEDDDDKHGRVEWDDINEIYNSTLDDAVEDYDGDPEDVNSEAMHDDFVMYLRKWNKMSNEEKDQYESIEDYFRDNINYKDYIPEADDDEE